MKLNPHRIDWFDITSGVKQGDNLSPTIFAMYLNDLAVSILLYADDIFLLAPYEEKLQVMIPRLADWCKLWRMVVNKDKTQIVHFRLVRHVRTNYNFMLDGRSLDTVDTYKYLGIPLDEHLLFNEAKSVSRTLRLIRYNLKFLKEYRCTTFTKLYTSYVCPIMDYSAGVWATKSYSSIEQVQFKALRYFDMYKYDYTQEDYLNLNIPKYHRSIFAQFRAGILSLQVVGLPLRNTFSMMAAKCMLPTGSRNY